MVNTITEEKGRGTEEGDCEGDSLEVMTSIVQRSSADGFANELVKDLPRKVWLGS